MMSSFKYVCLSIAREAIMQSESCQWFLVRVKKLATPTFSLAECVGCSRVTASANSALGLHIADSEPWPLHMNSCFVSGPNHVQNILALRGLTRNPVSWKPTRLWFCSMAVDPPLTSWSKQEVPTLHKISFFISFTVVTSLVEIISLMSSAVVEVGDRGSIPNDAILLITMSIMVLRAVKFHLNFNSSHLFIYFLSSRVHIREREKCSWFLNTLK